MVDIFNATGVFDLVAKTFFGLEGVLAEELKALGGAEVRQRRRAVAFRGDWRMLVRANVCLRTAVRVLVPIHAFNAHDERELYGGIGQVDWRTHLAAGGSLAIDPVVRSSIFTNSLYVAQRAKDAIVDQLRGATGTRPSVDRDDPDLRINLHVAESRVTVYLDSSGDSLHKRGYRTAAGEAPLNEVLAAGILRLAQWDERSALADFMCGSGTLVIEAALAARQIAPGTIRGRFGYMRWPAFDRALHEGVLAAARAAAAAASRIPDSRLGYRSRGNRRRSLQWRAGRRGQRHGIGRRELRRRPAAGSHGHAGHESALRRADESRADRGRVSADRPDARAELAGLLGPLAFGQSRRGPSDRIAPQPANSPVQRADRVPPAAV